MLSLAKKPVAKKPVGLLVLILAWISVWVTLSGPFLVCCGVL
jgi:hypothetical protein